VQTWYLIRTNQRLRGDLVVFEIVITIVFLNIFLLEIY
jgi:hypothetical protein